MLPWLVPMVNDPCVAPWWCVCGSGAAACSGALGDPMILPTLAIQIHMPLRQPEPVGALLLDFAQDARELLLSVAQFEASL